MLGTLGAITNENMKLLFMIFMLLAASIDLSGQLIGVYEQRNGLCSSTYLTFTDSTFTLERGCEGSSNFSIGTFSVDKDTIKFCSWGDTNKVLVKKIIRDQDTSKYLKIVILDNTGVNVTKKIAVTQVDNKDRYYTMTLDSTKTFRYDYKRPNSKVVLKQFVKPFKGQSEIHFLDSNSITVILNLDEDLLQSSKSNWMEIFNQKYLLDKNGFHSVMPYDALMDPVWKDQFFWIKK